MRFPHLTFLVLVKAPPNITIEHLGTHDFRASGAGIEYYDARNQKKKDGDWNGKPSARI